MVKVMLQKLKVENRKRRGGEGRGGGGRREGRGGGGRRERRGGRK